MAPADMRGLTQYIADLRACRVRELEEKRINKEMAHIRQKFKEGNLDGRSKKKYLSKIVFTYILGYPVSIGHMEAVNLISSTKYSEKQIGYLAITLLMNEGSELVRLVVNSVRKDLAAMNEVDNCLALHAVANIGGREMAESLAEDVHRLLISPTSLSFVKKKAALTLLRLYRKYPEVIPAAEWALRIVSIMDDSNLGVALAVTSLVMTLAQDNLEACAVCYQKAVNRLSKIVLEQDYPTDYIYYKVPIPWLQVKLLRLLQYYPPSDDPTLRQLLHDVLSRILKNSAETPKNVQHNNAQNAVLFEAINLAIHLDTESSIVSAAATLLGRFILSKETNVRYLGLDTMAHLAARSESLEAIKKHQDTIILSLRDKDISVRRRGLDLLYSMCDLSNSKVIVAELLRYLSVADYTLREEMVLKIAILTEKFAQEYIWYFDTVLRLMSLAGEWVGDEVWFRVVQIVTNTEELQEYAARKVFEHLGNPQCHENVVKVGAYILGEYGHLIADEPGRSPIEQFQLLHSRSNLVSTSTRALLLTTYFKWLNLFPEIREQIVAVFTKYSRVLDVELQQRACEYLAVARRSDGAGGGDGGELLQVVVDEMPPYPERESALLSRLMKKNGDTGDKRIWHVGGREVNKGADAERYKGYGRRKERDVADDEDAAPETGDVSEDLLGGLAGLDMGPPSLLPELDTPVVITLPTPAATAPLPKSIPATSLAAPVRKGSMPLTHGTDKWHNRLLYSPEGVLYEDGQLQIGIKTEFHGALGRIALFFGNKISVPLESFTATVEVEDPDAVGVTLPKITDPRLGAMSQIQQLVQVECRNIFTSSVPSSGAVILNVSYLAGSLQTLSLRLPIHLTKFLEPVQLSQTDFFERWKSIGPTPREAQSIFPIKLVDGGVDIARNRKIVAGVRFGILEGIEPNANNLVAAAVLHLKEGGKVGCLLRLEPNVEAKLCRLTIRSTNEAASSELLALLVGALSTK